MQPARVRDLGALTRLLLPQVARHGPSWFRRLHAVAAAPAVWSILTVTPGVHHCDRDVVAAITRCSAGSVARGLGRLAGLLAALLCGCVVWSALVWVMAYLSQYLGVSNERAMATFVASLSTCSFILELLVASTLVLLASYARPKWWRMPRSQWVLSSGAARPGVDGVDALRGLLLSVVPPGDTVGLVADGAEHATLSRLGFAPVRPGSLVMIATMPPPVGTESAPRSSSSPTP